MRTSRRAMLSSSLLTAACSRKLRPRDGKLHLQFSSWGEPVELRAFRRVIGRYQALHPDIRIDLEEISYNERSKIDMRIAAGVGPDLLRVQYLDVGRYAPSRALIDLSPYLPAALGNDFTPQPWAAVQYKRGVHALPHHTDTSAILYNKAAFRKLGIRVPETVSDSWSWEQFIDVALTLKRSFEYGFAVNWTMGGAFRWLNFLYQHGGSLDAIQEAPAFQTLEWTQSFFRRQLVPASDSAKSGEQLENLFASEVVGMYFDVGPQSLRELEPKLEWSATFLPRDQHLAAELGGNAIGVTRDCHHPELAADFALFLTNEENMADFASAAQFIPVRRNLLRHVPVYRYHPDEMQVHLQQSTTVPVDLAQAVTTPDFHRIHRAFADELDLAFTGGQGASETLANIARAVSHAT